MAVYLFALVIMLLLPLATKNKYITIVLFGAVMWFLAAFRNLNIGMFDTTGTYFRLYNDALALSLSDIILDSTYPETIFFELIDKVIQFFVGTNYQAYIAVLSLFYIVCFCASIMCFANERNWSAVQIAVACVVYFSLIYFYSYTMLRQYAALSVLVAFAYPCIRKRKPIAFLLSIGFASMLHSTALIFIVAYPLCVFVAYKKKHLVLILVLSALGTLAPQLVMTALNSVPIPMLQARLGYIAHGIYEADTTGVGYGTIIFLTVLAVFYMWRKRADFDNTYSELLWLISLGIVFQGWSHVIVEFYRVAMYFIVFNAFLLPERLQLIPKRNRSVFTLATIVVFVVYGIFVLGDNVGVIPYSFCWDTGAWSY